MPNDDSDRMASFDKWCIARRTIEARGGHEICERTDEHALTMCHSPFWVSSCIGDVSEVDTKRAGALAFVPAALPRETEWSTEQTGGILCLTQLSLHPKSIARFADELEIEFGELRPLLGVYDDELRTCVEMLYDVSTGIHSGSALLRDTLLNQIVLALVLGCSTRKHVLRQLEFAATVGGVARIRNAVELLHDEVSANYALQTLADSCNLSKFHFCRAFKRTTGVTPHQYQLRIRIEKACRLLRSRSLEPMSLANIAVECGFTDQSHLSRVFTRIVGTTPGKYAEEA